MSNTCYLILLKDADDRKKWGLGENGEYIDIAVAWYGNEKYKWTFTGICEDPTFPSSYPWLMVYSDHAIEDSSCEDAHKKKLFGLFEKASDLRIFHHGGALNPGEMNTSDVLAKFKEVGFIDAGFKEEIALMPFSGTAKFPWEDDIDNVMEACRSKKINVSFDDVREKLACAWDKARTYFFLEIPVHKLIDALFPLYVDLCNREFTKLEEAEFQAALGAAKKDIETSLSSIGFSGGLENLQRALTDIKKSPAKDKKQLAEAGDSLLGAFEKLTFPECEDFMDRFDQISTVYAEMLKLPETALNDECNLGDRG